MIALYVKPFIVAVGVTVAATAAIAAQPPQIALDWATVVNNNDEMPGAPGNRTFNSYNQPSVNAAGVVVIRARSQGGAPYGPATHGIYTRDMSATDTPIVRILDRTTPVVPAPNNLGSRFVETPSFPRIDISSNTIATRGNHEPVWRYGTLDDETQVGTTGIYANPFGNLITAASKLGGVPGFDFFEVPGATPWTMFDVFPGAPSVTRGTTIVFKGNYTADGQGKTGVFYRDLEDAAAGGTSPVRMIANNTDTLIPGTATLFGSTSPPSAAGGRAVFAGFDNEEEPGLGGLYLTNLRKPQRLVTLVEIGEDVPWRPRSVFNRLGEAVSFDGTRVGFWGAWGSETRTVRLYCPTEGNKDRIAYCNRNLVCADTGNVEEDTNSICDPEDPKYPVCYQEKEVPISQGIFVHDTEGKGDTRLVAATDDVFDDFVFWNYSGKSPCVGIGGHGQEGAEDDGEPARWRSSAFVAVSGQATVFKAMAGDAVGIYLERRGLWTVVDTTMDGRDLDPEAPADSTVTEVGLEREGLRGQWLAVNAKMNIEAGTEEDGMAGVYLASMPTVRGP
jgi:hypothetical protein